MVFHVILTLKKESICRIYFYFLLFIPFIYFTLDVDPCFPNPCKNNGVCKDIQGSAKCDCPPSHKGPFCTGMILIVDKNKWRLDWYSIEVTICSRFY